MSVLPVKIWVALSRMCAGQTGRKTGTTQDGGEGEGEGAREGEGRRVPKRQGRAHGNSSEVTLCKLIYSGGGVWSHAALCHVLCRLAGRLGPPPDPSAGEGGNSEGEVEERPHKKVHWLKVSTDRNGTNLPPPLSLSLSCQYAACPSVIGDSHQGATSSHCHC